MMRYFLGVDVGGTKSHALIADETGQALGFGQAGPGNHEVVGYDGLRQVLGEITAQAEAMAGIRRAEIAGAGFGLGGYDWPSERAATLEAIAVLGLQAPVEAVNDTIVGLLAGAEQGWGVALVAGTSNNCRGWDKSRREGRVLGNGAEFGEHGGAYELVLRAVQDVAKAWTRRGPPTALTDAFVRWAGAAAAADLLEGLSQERYFLGGEAAPLVFQVAEQGDPVALAAIRWNAEELASLAVGVIRQLQLQNEAFDVVLVGSFYNAGPLLLNPLAAAIHTAATQARLVRLTVPPVVGATLLGMKVAGVDPAPVRARLIESARMLYERTGLVVAADLG